jgi:pimeloyl-ACP methyl ester carboxylesterase
LFLHGNTENLDKYADALNTMSKLGYKVFALEYAGYGAAKPAVGNCLAPNARSMETDLMEAWEICGNRYAIIMGFSMGGGLLGVTYPYLCPAPAQIVFLNSFDSFPKLVEENLSPCLAKLTRGFLATDWRTRECENYCGRVLIVVTKDDKLVPYRHGLAIADNFSCKQVVTVKLKHGGHVKAILRYRHCWTPYLLPP